VTAEASHSGAWPVLLNWATAWLTLPPTRRTWARASISSASAWDYLRRLLAAVSDFEAAFNAWMTIQEEATHAEARGLFPTVSLKSSADPARARELELKVAETAGAAAKAVAVTGAYILVAGIGPLDPISNWFTMSSPKAALSPHDIRSTTAAVKGRLTSLIAEAEAVTDADLPAFSPAQLHPVVWAAAAAHWTSHHYRVAVREAAEALTIHWKAKLDRHDVDDTVFWQQTLSAGEPTLQSPKLLWPGDQDTKTAKSMRGGLEPLAKALTKPGDRIEPNGSQHHHAHPRGAV